MTTKEIKDKISEMCKSEKAQVILQKESDDALHCYIHIFCTTNSNNVAFIAFDENDIASVGFKAKAKKADYEKVLEYLETIFADAEEADNTPWEERQVAVSLTNKEWSRLRCYLLMTTHYREDEMEACKRLSEEREPDGTPTYPNMASNAQFWKDMIDLIEFVGNKIDAR